jgi:hypothetical protein
MAMTATMMATIPPALLPQIAYSPTTISRTPPAQDLVRKTTKTTKKRRRKKG